MKCGACPVAGPCVGERDGWGFACEKVEAGADPSFLAWLRVASDAAVEPPAYPSLATQAANLAKAAGRFVASGLAVADRAERDRRRSICQACPTGRYDAEAQRCRGCGCYASLKPWSKAEHCPDGHW